MGDRRRIVGSGLVFAALLLVCLVALVGLQTGASPSVTRHIHPGATSPKSAQSSRLGENLRNVTRHPDWGNGAGIHPGAIPTVRDWKASANSAFVATSAKEAGSQSSRLDRGLRSVIMVLKGQSDNSSTRTIARRLKRVFVKLNKASTVNRRRTI